jgi:hypothetical protein
MFTATEIETALPKQFGSVLGDSMSPRNQLILYTIVWSLAASRKLHDCVMKQERVCYFLDNRLFPGFIDKAQRDQHSDTTQVHWSKPGTAHTFKRLHQSSGQRVHRDKLGRTGRQGTITTRQQREAQRSSV